jgi:hypothetical protein
MIHTPIHVRCACTNVNTVHQQPRYEAYQSEGAGPPDSDSPACILTICTPRASIVSAALQYTTVGRATDQGGAEDAFCV